MGEVKELTKKMDRLEEVLIDLAVAQRIIPVMATFNPEPDLVNLATKRKVLLVGMSGAYVEALNPEVVSNGRSGG